MSLFISSLNSGSNGNCYYIGNDSEAVLIDAGISCRETERRMARTGLSMEKVKAIFISHEHSDHIRGVEVLSRKYKLSVYITDQTLKASQLLINEELIRSFRADETILIGGLTITPFVKFHDAADPHSFIIEENNICIGVLTDIGVPCENVIRHFKKCHAAFLEANYDEELLDNGGYPYYLKKRIKGGRGHLSNHQALDIFVKNRSAQLSHLFLSHLSRDNNSPDMVRDLFIQHSTNTEIVVASRYYESAVYNITSGGTQKLSLAVPVEDQVVQMTLF